MPATTEPSPDFMAAMAHLLEVAESGQAALEALAAAIRSVGDDGC